MRKRAEGNANWIALGAITLGLVGFSQVGELFAPATATAQPEGVPFNAAAQRKVMIEQLQLLNQRMALLESKLDRGISVKVTEMPAIKVDSGNKD